MAGSTSTAAACSRLGALRPAGPAQPLAARGAPRRRPALTAAAQGMSEADMYQGVDPMPQQVPESAGGPPLYVAVPAAVAGLVVALRAGRMIKKRMGGSSRLEERGFKKGGVADDRAYAQAIKGMRRIQYEELSPEQIEAARRRRRREVEKDELPLDLEQIELPENHPFAVKKRLAPEEEALQRSRLSARRGLSAEDMRKLREQQALADQMDAEEEARQAARRTRG